MATSTERARVYHARQRERGFVPLHIWVRADQYADIKIAVEQISKSGGLELGPIRDTRTGKFLKKGG